MQPIPEASQLSEVSSPGTVLLIETWSGDEGEIIIGLRGEIDKVTAPDLQAVVATAACVEPVPTAIVLDLAGVSFVDSIGIGAIVSAHGVCERAGLRLAARNPSKAVTRLFALTGIRELLARW